MVEYEAIIESAIFRRNPMTFMASVPFSSVRARPPIGEERLAPDAPPAM